MMFNGVVRKAVLSACMALLLVTALFGIFFSQHTANAASSVTINSATTYQTMDGFGVSDAFGPASTLQTSPASEQKQVLDALFSTSTGAGFTILRNLFPSDAANTIEPTSPGSPSAAPQYVPLGSSEGQIWLAQQAQSYGVKQFYGDAWSAPGFMKTNGDESNGGTLCGSPGATTCSTGDWRQAYANYLLQYVKDYQAAGVPLTEVGAFNEPNLTTSYSSMVMNPTQTADFVAILGPTLKGAGLGSVKIVCCDGEGWDTAQSYASGIANNPTANAYTSIISSHGYTQDPNTALTGTGTKHIWQTEWSKFDTWDPNWDTGTDASGFTWAQYINKGITVANLSAFLYWWGVGFNSSDNGALIHDNSGTVTVSKRLYAMGNYSRFIHPGAVRIGTSTADSNLSVTAYKNTDGTTSIVVLNNAYSDISASFSGVSGASAVPYITNATNNIAAQTALPIANSSFSATVPARSLVTYLVSGTGTTPTVTPTPSTTPVSTVTPTPVHTPTPTPVHTPTPTPGTTPTASACKVSYVIQNQWPGGFTNSTVITNTGTTALSNWTLKFTFPGTQSVIQGWNATFSQQGEQITATNLSYNGSIAPGGSTSLGFNGSWSGSNPNPTSFTLNGTTCSIS